jgi:hypothetical protein
MCLAFLGLTACQNQKKTSSSPPPPPTNVAHGNFINDQQLDAARKSAQVNREACAKWCGGPVSSATDNPNKIGCSAERCKELFPVGKKLFKRCEGTDCNNCNATSNTYYSVNCDETLDGCLVMFSSMSGCE